ncbi:hypothetical protein RRG08_044755 [Elysia crispata]|uniref:Uncharacterized protein n=1 Tax=Elysia crispata TaxID=231223 RepID=A0AAE1DH38_9GAST|nr:hypothetical protein RRG08_044755 [Elysia crispata]
MSHLSLSPSYFLTSHCLPINDNSYSPDSRQFALLYSETPSAGWTNQARAGNCGSRRACLSLETDNTTKPSLLKVLNPFDEISRAPDPLDWFTNTTVRISESDTSSTWSCSADPITTGGHRFQGHCGRVALKYYDSAGVHSKRRLDLSRISDPFIPSLAIVPSV